MTANKTGACTQEVACSSLSPLRTLTGKVVLLEKMTVINSLGCGSPAASDQHLIVRFFSPGQTNELWVYEQNCCKILSLLYIQTMCVYIYIHTHMQKFVDLNLKCFFINKQNFWRSYKDSSLQLASCIRFCCVSISSSSKWFPYLLKDLTATSALQMNNT